MTVSAASRATRTAAVASKPASKVSHVALTWSPGQGMRPPNGIPVRRWGLYVSAQVPHGEQLTVKASKVDAAKHQLTLTVDAKGKATAGKRQTEDAFAGNFGGTTPTKWTVTVKDASGHVLSKKAMTLGGPPAP